MTISFNGPMRFSGPAGLAVAAAGGEETPLYTFTTFTFTNANTTGRLGPTKSALLASYDTTTYSWLNDTAYYDMPSFQGYQLWTIPTTGNYTIVATGASSGSAGTKGAAAVVTATVSLTQGQKIWIVVGQQRNTNIEVGEGGTWVVLSNNGTIAGSTPLVIAGGAGDYSYHASENATYHASAPTTQSYADAILTDGISPDSLINVSTGFQPTAPTTGNGGTINNGSGTGNGSGGGGFNTDGDLYPTNYFGMGQSFFNGLCGGMYQFTSYNTTTLSGGGFGGGGSRNGGFGTGGGGGYTGGLYTGSSASLRRSTGGSCYITPSATNTSRALYSGVGAPNAIAVQGSVVITKV